MTPDLYAERALLAALLRDPRQIRKTLQLTGIDDSEFGDPGHAQLMRAIIDASQDETLDLSDIDGWNTMRRTVENAAVAGGRSRAWVHEIAASRITPSQAVEYAVMVHEGATRRGIAAHAQRIADMISQAPPEQVSAQITIAHNVMIKLAELWRLDPEILTAEATEADDTEVLETPQAPSLLQRGLAALRAPLPFLDGTARTEDRLLASLVTDPGQIAEVRGWLDLEDFTAPGRAEIYAALVDLADRNRPIDAPTVLFEASRQVAISARQADRFMAHCAKAEPGQAISLARTLVATDTAAYISAQAQKIITTVTAGTATPSQAIGVAMTTLQRMQESLARLNTGRQVTASDSMVYVPPPPDRATMSTPPNAKTSM
ncbi:DnaB-like helicase N-terminal domain-containing protein [Streptosporangium sp. NPDC048047]|uniref:DnaB-like helicase N-terminal domain-containing protein n=1 Tax=Streptosporangium sp. NPDC048047 TaxID=3155748 RepID=UPI00342740B6